MNYRGKSGVDLTHGVSAPAKQKDYSQNQFGDTNINVTLRDAKSLEWFNEAAINVTKEYVPRKLTPPDIMDDYTISTQKMAERRDRRENFRRAMLQVADYLIDKMEKDEDWTNAHEIHDELCLIGESVKGMSRTQRMERFINKALGEKK